MRIILVMIFTAFCMLGSVSISAAGTYQGAGNYSGTPSPEVTRLFASFPNGGDGLAAAIRQLLINDSSLADDVAFVASRGNADQQTAAADGMAQALTVLLNRGDTGGAGSIISAAQNSGNPTLQTAVASSSGGNQGSNTGQGQNQGSSSNVHCTTTTTTTAATSSAAASSTTTTTCQ